MGKLRQGQSASSCDKRIGLGGGGLLSKRWHALTGMAEHWHKHLSNQKTWQRLNSNTFNTCTPRCDITELNFFGDRYWFLGQSGELACELPKNVRPHMFFFAELHLIIFLPFIDFCLTVFKSIDTRPAKAEAKVRKDQWELHGPISCSSVPLN